MALNRQQRRRQQALDKKRNQPVDIIFAAGDWIEARADDGTLKSVNVVAYTGGKLSLGNFKHPVVIDIRGVQIHDGDREQQPLLRDHDTKRTIGHGTPVVEGGHRRLRVEGSLSMPGQDRDDVLEAQKGGFKWQASVGGRIPDKFRDVQFVARGKSVVVNGQNHQGPVFVVRAFLWKETSFVSLGADEGCATAAVAAQAGVPVMDKKFEAWLQAAGMNPEDYNDEQLEALQTAHTATATIEPPKEPDLSGIQASMQQGLQDSLKEMTQQQRAIDRLFAQHTDVMDSAKLDELRGQVESGDISLDGAHVQLLQAARSSHTSNVAKASQQNSDNLALTLEASVARSNLIQDDDIKDMLAAAGGTAEQIDAAMQESTTPRFRDGALSDLVHAVLRQHNHVCGGRLREEDVNAAMYYSQQDVIQANFGGGFSTVSLPGILSRLANKAMLAAYAEADRGGVMTRIASITSTTDFKKFNRYRLTEAGIAEEVPASGQIPHGTLIEEEYENQVKQHARIIALTRVMMTNDDLGAFLQIPRLLGRQARHALEQTGITTLVDTPTNAGAGTNEFFHGAIRGNQEPNYLEGANTALSLDSLELAYNLFLNQVDADGKPVMIDPKILLTTNGDAVMAAKLYNDVEYRFTVSDLKETVANQWKGMFRPEKSSYLHRLGTTPNSTQWYLLGDPSVDFSGIQVAFLNGRRVPQISSSDVQFNLLGMQWRVVYDFGVAMQDPRCIVKVKGAA